MNRGVYWLLDWVVKLTSMILTVPVTWTVARQLFSDVGDPFRTAMQVAAVLLVDGLLLRDWVLLDTEPNAPPERKARYASTVLLIYVGLLVLAIQHGEGVAGLVFRVAIGIGIVSSVLTSFGDTLRRNLDKAAKHGLRADWRVQAHSRRLGRREARLERESKSRVFAAQVLAAEQIRLREIEVAMNRQLGQIESGSSDHSIDFPNPSAVLPAPNESPISTATATASENGDGKRQLVAVLRQINPDVSVDTLAGLVKVSRSTLYRWLREEVG